MAKASIVSLSPFALSIQFVLPVSAVNIIKARDAPACSDVNGPFPLPKASASGSPTSAPAITTAPAPGSTNTPASSTAPAPGGTTPSCTYMGPEPPENPSGFCTCENESTLPLLTLSNNNAPQSASCSYTAQPSGLVTQPNPSPSVTTNSDTCQVCTPYAANGDTCTILAGCTPQKRAATVELGSSVVNFGTLTSTALYTSVSNALTSLCPTGTQACSKETATIKGISYISTDIEKETLLETDGELEIWVQSSQYTASSLLL